MIEQYKTIPLLNSDEVIIRVRRHTNTLIKAAQEVIDLWDFDQGGCCDKVASRIAELLWLYEDLDARSTGQDGGEHTWVVIPANDGIVNVDIPYQIYEVRKAMYHYEPTMDRLRPEHLLVEFMDVSPKDAGLL